MQQLHIVTKYFFPVLGGIEKSVEELYSRFSSDLWQITVHTGNQDLGGKAIPTMAPTVVAGLHVRRYPVRLGFFWPRLDFGSAGAVSLQNFDLVPHLLILFYAWLLQVLRRKKVRIFLSPHGGFCPNWHTFPFIPRVIKKSLHSTLGVFLINRVVEKVQVVSEWERGQLVAGGVRPELLVQVENGLEEASFSDVETTASANIRTLVAEVGRYILQVGKLYPEKNYETTIRALALLPADVNYVILGQEVSSGYKQSLQALANKLGVGTRLHFWGYVDGVDKYYVYRHASVVVHMALWENFCTVVHEALSQGVVCVVSNRAVLPYLVKDGVNGFCVEAQDYKAEAEKINFLLDLSNLSQVNDMKARNRAYGSTHTWNNLALQMEQFYSTVK